MKKRDAKGYAKFLKEQQEKKQKNKSTNNKEKNSSEIVKTKKHISDLTDNELRKLNDRIKLENEYNRTIREYNQNKRTATNTIKKMSKTVLEPALTNASKNVVEDLLTKIGKTMNYEINESFKKSFKEEKELTEEEKERKINQQRLKDLQTKLSIQQLEEKLKK